MTVVKNYNYILDSLKLSPKKIDLIVVTKSQPLNKINLLIKENHLHFGENRVQEATLKWKDLIINYPQLKIHLIGKLQSNKAQQAFEIFHYIHSLDNEKLANIFSKLERNSLKKIKYFIQVNIGSESQKSGVDINELDGLIDFCRTKTNLDIVGLMCIPPLSENPIQYFEKLKILAINHNLKELSMGMSNDFNSAIQSGSTFVRIGSAILGNRIS